MNVRASYVLICCLVSAVAACSGHREAGWATVRTDVLSCGAHAEDCLLDSLLGDYLIGHPEQRIAAVVPVEGHAHHGVREYGTTALLVLHSESDGSWPKAKDIEATDIYGCDPFTGIPIDDCKKTVIEQYRRNPRPYLYWLPVEDAHELGIGISALYTTSPGPDSTAMSVDLVSCLVHVDHEARQGAAGCRDSLELFLQDHADERIASIVPMSFSAPESQDYQTRALLVLHTKEGPWSRARELAVAGTSCDPDGITSQCTDGEIASHPRALDYALWFSIAGTPQNILYLYRRD